MFSDVSSLWSSANNAFQNIGENLSNALEHLEDDLEDMENSQLSESEIYKKLLDDAQMDHYKLSKQVQIMMAEKQSEVAMWKNKYFALSGEEDEEEKAKDEKCKGVEANKLDLSTLSADEKDTLLRKTMAEMEALKTCIAEVESRMKISLHEKNEATACLEKSLSLEKENKILRNRLKVDNDESHAEIQNKSDEIDDLVSEYSKLASESERQKSSDTQRIKEVELENEVLTMRMQALEHSLAELADRSTGTKSGSSTSGESPGSGGGNSSEMKDLKARLVHLEYDIKSKEETILSLKERQKQAVLAPSSSVCGDDVSVLQHDMAKQAEEVANLKQDVSRLQIEKKEAEAAGKSFFEQYKELKKASQANESALLVEVEQDLSAAQMDYKKSQETVAKLEEQVAKLQAELQAQSAETNKGSTESVEVQQQLAKLQSELDRSKEEVNELHARITSKDDELAKAREAAESLEHDIKSGKSESDEELLASQMDHKKSQETVAKLEEQVAKLQAELQVQSAEAIKGSTENVEVQQQLAKLQSELDRSKEEVNELHARITSKDDELAKAREAAESLEHDIKSGKSESDETSTALLKEKELLLDAQKEVAQLKLDIENERTSADALNEEWKLKYCEAQEASKASSLAVDEAKKNFSEKLEQQAQAHQQLMADTCVAHEKSSSEQANMVQDLQAVEATLKLTVESLEKEIETLKNEIVAKNDEISRDKEAHAAALANQETELREAACKQAAEQVASAVSDAQVAAEAVLQESLKDQALQIRQECSDIQETALKAQADQLAAESKCALEEKDAKHEQACKELTTQLEEATKTALADQQRELETAHASAISALEALRVEDQNEAKQKADEVLETHQKEVALLKAARDAVQLELDNVEETNRLKTEAAIAEFRIESDEKLVQAVAAIRNEMQSQVDVAEAAREEYLQLYTKESKARKAIHNKLMEIQGNIRVVCRVRPILDVERKQAKGADVDATEILSEEDIIVHRDASTKNRFEFDRVFPPGGTQSEVFASVQPLIVSVLDGYNVCIFAYGQTGSGKTFTMEGYGDDPESKGVSPRAIDDLFSFIRDSVDNWTYTVSFSMLEIYNETIRDLLVEPVTTSGKAVEVVKLDIRQTATGNVVAGLTEVEVAQSSEVLDLMNRGQKNRAVGAHDMNEHSSRSHSILTLTVRGVNNKDGSTTCGKLHLIDLAGSERVGKTDATGDRLKEAQNINRSLSALGDVINSLGSKKSSHVPYRNSKLTFLLQDSLGGNSKVLMFVNISPAVYNVNESICSLNFAFRCRNVELGQAKKQVGNGSSSGGAAQASSTPSKLSSSTGGRSALGRSSTSSSSTLRK